MQSAIEGLQAMVRDRRYSTLWEAAAEFIEFGRERHHAMRPLSDDWVQAGRSLFRGRRVIYPTKILTATGYVSSLLAR